MLLNRGLTTGHHPPHLVSSRRSASPLAREAVKGVLVVAQKLRELHDEQRLAVSELGLRRRQAPRDLSELVSLAPEVLGAACRGFSFGRSMAGSWIAGQSLVMQLLVQPRLTVDLTLDALNADRPFDIPFESLLDLAGEGYVYLNVRDYDGDPDLTKHDQERPARRLEQLFRQARPQLYIGSAIRKSIFDTALEHSGYDYTYETIQKSAETELKDAHSAFSLMPSAHETVQASLFRNERPGLTPVSWHWAFLNSVKHYLPARAVTTRGKELFDSAVERGRDWSKTPTSETQLAAAEAFADLATHLRACHLSYTAPITASYGTDYNMTSDEYASSVSVSLGHQPVPSEEVRRFLTYVLAKARDYTAVGFEELGQTIAIRDAATEIDKQIFHRGNIADLIRAMAQLRPKIEEATNILNSIEDAYKRDEELPEGRLNAMVRDYQKVSQANIDGYARALGQVWDKLVKPAVGVAGVFANPITPWVTPFFSDWAKAQFPTVIERLRFLPRRERSIYRVYRVFRD